MLRRVVCLLLLLCPITHLPAQATPIPAPPAAPLPTPATPFAGLIAEYLRRNLSGHSPAPDEIAAMQTLQPTPDAAAVKDALPFLLRALESHDTPLRTFALTTLVGLRTEPLPVAPTTSAASSNPDTAAPSPAPAITILKADTARSLTLALPAILAHLTEESNENRILTVTIAGGFQGNAPAAIYPPLQAYLRRDDAVSPIGLSVVQTLLALGPISADTSLAIAKYLRRSDQRDNRSELVDAIATATNQGKELNAALVKYLDADDARLRARLILSLPQLDLAQDVFADMKSRVDQLAASSQENLQVVTAARAVTACWTSTKMASGCPAY